jgi:hypothetical protein
MKTLSQIREEYEAKKPVVDTETLEEAAQERMFLSPKEMRKTNDINNIPPMIMLKRRAIRTFPDGQKVALYWADKIRKFVTIPYGSFGLQEGFWSKGLGGGMAGAANAASGGQISKIADAIKDQRERNAEAKAKADIEKNKNTTSTLKRGDLEPRRRAAIERQRTRDSAERKRAAKDIGAARKQYHGSPELVRKYATARRKG